MFVGGVEGIPRDIFLTTPVRVSRTDFGTGDLVSRNLMLIRRWRGDGNQPGLEDVIKGADVSIEQHLSRFQEQFAATLPQP